MALYIQNELAEWKENTAERDIDVRQLIADNAWLSIR